MAVKYFHFWDYKTTPKANWEESGFDYHKDEVFMEYHKSNPEWFHQNIFETPNVTNSTFSHETQSVKIVNKPYLHLYSEQDINSIDEKLGKVLPDSVKELFHLYGSEIYRNMLGPYGDFPRFETVDISRIDSHESLEKWMNSYPNPNIQFLFFNLKGCQFRLEKKIGRYKHDAKNGKRVNQRYSFLGLYPFLTVDGDYSAYFLMSKKIKRGLFYFFNFFSSQPLEYLGSMSDYIQRTAQPKEYYGDKFHGIREQIDKEIFYTNQKVKASSNTIVDLLKQSEVYENLTVEFSSLGFLIKNDKNLKTIFILIAHDNMYEYMQSNIPQADYLFSYYYKKVINEKELVLQDIFANLEMLGFGKEMQ